MARNRFACIASVILVIISMIVLSPSSSSVTISKQDRYDIVTIKERLLEPIMNAPDRATVERYMNEQNPDGTWDDVDYENQNPGNFTTTRHLSNLRILARAYVSPTSDLKGDAELRKKVYAGLDFWLGKDFRNPNWWWNVIGVPGSMARILLLLDDELSDEHRTRGVEIVKRAKISMTGANLADVAFITVMRGVLEKSPEIIGEAVSSMTGEIRISTEEGIQPDFSFQQHGALLYNHGYGAVFMDNCSELAVITRGTRFAFSREKIDILNGLILDGTQWMIRYATKDYGATGRGISRRQGSSDSAGYLRSVVDNMLLLPTGREADYRDLKSRLNGGGPPLVGNRHFWRGDIMTHHRPGYYVSARMYSDRMLNTDGPHNREGLASHHISDGCTFIMRTGREYHDIFPLWDWFKIPGTTVEQAEELTGDVKIPGTRSFVGGVSDGMYGCAAFDFERGGLEARKAWFFFDDEIVCIGAGIRSSSGRAVVTTVNQCFLKGEVTASSGGSSRKLEQGNHTLDDTRWLYHDGVAYVFPERQSVRLTNRIERGSWWSINNQHSKDELSGGVFTLRIEHGENPDGGRYSYIVAPDMPLSSVAGYAADLPVRILSNTPELQAVRHDGLNITGAAFYSPGSVRLDERNTVAVDRPCLVLVRETADDMTISVSNPENKQCAVTVTVSRSAVGATGVSPTVVTFDLPGGMDAGKSVMKNVRTGGR